MRIVVGVPPWAASEAPTAGQFRSSVAAAFRAEGQAVDQYVDVGGEIEELPALVVIITLQGLVWDAEKAAFRRAMAAIRRIKGEHGTAITRIQRLRRQPVEYFVPSGPEGDRALDAIEADYATDPPPGQRGWSPDIGWMSQNPSPHRPLIRGAR